MFGVRGTLVDSRPDWSLRVARRALIVVDADGVIRHRADDVDEAQAKNIFARFNVNNVIRLDDEHEFLMPGLIDSHVHAAQFPNAGLGLDLPLLEWLEKYTYPTEKRFGDDPEFAPRAYAAAVEATLAHGTTCAAYYATLHEGASHVLCDVVARKGQRALIGKVSMHRNGVEGYEEADAVEVVASARRFVEVVMKRGNRLVQPIVTPRFAISCDDSALEGLAKLAKEFDLRIQTHLSESKPEVEFIKELFPKSVHYAGVYANAGLLTPKTIMAHCVHLSDKELVLMRESGAGISHCPNSNSSLKSGNFDVLRAKSAGVKIGLGTDCSGGYSASMIDAMRFAVGTSNQVAMMKGDNYRPISYEDAIYLATRGSAIVTSLEAEVGVLEVGLRFDAIRVRVNVDANPASAVFGRESVRDLVQKFVFLGDDRNVVQVFVDGKIVKSTI